MLKKIVNMIMGSSEDRGTSSHTYFEGLLDEVIPKLSKGFEDPDSDALDVLATALLLQDVGQPDLEPHAQAARAYFSVLVENDRQPRSEQLSVPELELLKSLLLEYFSGRRELQSKANEVIALIERKFSEGAFTQARILLQIFETDHETRLNNERNLFYEDMILRLGVRRRHEIGDTEATTLHDMLEPLNATKADGVRKALSWMADEFYVQFCLALRMPKEQESWNAIVSKIKNTDSRDRLLRYVPPLRWRTVPEMPELPLPELLKRHVTPASLKQHILGHTRMCYFLLLASGDTGFEDYLYRYLAWCRDALDVEGKRVLPQLHRRSVLEERGLVETLDNLYGEFFEDAVAKCLESIDEERFAQAWNTLITDLAKFDINEIPPGFYDLGGFLLDRLLGFEQPTPYFGFRLYRLT